MRIKLLLFFIYQLLLILWSFKIHDHYFEFTTADQIGLVSVALLPLFLVRTKIQLPSNLYWLLTFILPITLLPIIHFSLAYFSDSWIFIYLTLMVCGALILLGKESKWPIVSIGSLVLVWFLPFSFLPNQSKYYDRLTQTIETRFGEVDIVSWKADQWIYYNNSLSLSTVDGHMHAETLVHTTLPFFENPQVLLIGDDFGFTRKEVDKYTCELIHIPFDSELAKKTVLYQTQNDVHDAEILPFLESENQIFDVIIIDLPDPEHLTYLHYYEDYFYRKCIKNLSQNGLLITNAGSYYSSNKDYQSVESTLQVSGLTTTRLQALIPTLGHRVWIIASRKEIDLDEINFTTSTEWINRDAVALMLSEGKESYPF